MTTRLPDDDTICRPNRRRLPPPSNLLSLDNNGRVNKSSKRRKTPGSVLIKGTVVGTGKEHQRGGRQLGRCRMQREMCVSSAHILGSSDCMDTRKAVAQKEPCFANAGHSPRSKHRKTCHEVVGKVQGPPRPEDTCGKYSFHGGRRRLRLGSSGG